MLTIDGLSCRLGGFAISGVSFSVAAGDYFVLLGESGAGKTVILELITGLITPEAGRILWDGTDLTQQPIQRRNLGLVYQDHALFPHLTVRQNIGYALPRSEGGCIAELAERVGAQALLDRRPATLSLGEAQRVALARTLARRPRVLLLDEPLASLDVQARTGIRSLLRRLHKQGQTLIHVTHDYEEAVALASRVAVLEQGRIVQIGTPDEIFHRPRSRFVSEFVGIRNFFRGQIVREPGQAELVTAAGVRFALAGEAASGTGCIVFESLAVTVHTSRPDGSARNVFAGTIRDIEPVPQGVELAIDVGETVFALITRTSLEQMGLACGARVWVSFKSTAVRFIPDGDTP